MLKKCIRLCALLAVGTIGVSGALADINVEFYAQDSVIASPGQTVLVDILADIPVADATLVWGLDLNVVDPAIATWELVGIGPAWIDAGGTIDGDGLAGLAFPLGVYGDDILLATVEFTGVSEGITGIGLGADGEDEGFGLDPDGFANVIFGTGTVEVLPEPTTLLLLSLGLALVRRR
ncbi:MAG: PEP-CTERM sorting domain-containing protein [Phycisphaerae bacterium]|nr:PEP-CTERM sorting domain-containing protein [Phycisphaerae bacterium]